MVIIQLIFPARTHPFQQTPLRSFVPKEFSQMRVILSLQQCFQTWFSEVYYRIWKVKWLLMFPLLRWKQVEVPHCSASLGPVCSRGLQQTPAECHQGLERAKRDITLVFFYFPPPSFPALLRVQSVTARAEQGGLMQGGPTHLHQCSPWSTPGIFGVLWGGEQRVKGLAVSLTLFLPPQEICVFYQLIFFPSSLGM